MEYTSFPDFIKSELKAVPMRIAQPQMIVGAVLERKLLGGFVRVGTLSGLCAATDYQEELKRELANVEALQHPFAKQTTQEQLQGFWKANSSGFLGIVVPNTAEVQLWIKLHSTLKMTVSEITTHYLKDDYLLEIIANRKWTPNVDSLKDLYIINEIVLASSIKINLSGGVEGGAGSGLDLSPIGTVEAGVTYSQDSDGGLNIYGVMENGQRKPFAIAFRTAHVVYKKDFKLKKPMQLGVRRGEDDGHHISAFVGKDEKYHIGEFFLKTNEEEEVDLDPIDFDEDSV